MSHSEIKSLQDAMAMLVVTQGRVVDVGASCYGWLDYDATAHIHGYGRWGSESQPNPCPIVTHGKAIEDTWSEFQGTFFEGDDSVHGISVKDCSCACDKVKDREMRYEAEVTQVINDVIRIVLGWTDE